MVKAKPDEYHSVTPYLRMRDAAGAIEFYKRAFGAKEIMRMPAPDGRVMHAELKIGDSVVMVGEPMGESAAAHGAPIAGLLVYVDDVDGTFRKATAAGAHAEGQPENMFYGDRMGSVIDPYGHEWMLATHVEDVPEGEMQRRMAAESQRMANARN